MKKAILLIFLLCSARVWAQNKSLFGQVFTNVTLTGLNLDMGYAGTKFKSNILNGFHFNSSVVLGKHYSTGLYFETYSTSHIVYDSLRKAVNPKFALNLFTWHNEILIMPERTLNFGIPINVGLADARYKDHYNPGNSNNNVLQIANRTFFTAQAGLNVYLNLFSHVSMYVGANYRYCKGASLFASDAQFSNFAFIGGIRAKLYEPSNASKQTPVPKKQTSYFSY